MTLALPLAAQTPTVITIGDYTATITAQTIGACYTWTVTVPAVSAWTGRQITRGLDNGAQDTHADAVRDAVRSIASLAAGLAPRHFVHGR